MSPDRPTAHSPDSLRRLKGPQRLSHPLGDNGHLCGRAPNSHERRLQHPRRWPPEALVLSHPKSSPERPARHGAPLQPAPALPTFRGPRFVDLASAVSGSPCGAIRRFLETLHGPVATTTHWETMDIPAGALLIQHERRFQRPRIWPPEAPVLSHPKSNAGLPARHRAPLQPAPAPPTF